MQARICYKERSLSFRHACFVIHKKLRSLPDLASGAHQGVGVGKLTLPASTELIVQLQVSAGSRIGEGLVKRAEIAAGVHLAESLVKVNNGHIIINILNTREQDVELPNSVVEMVELRDRDVGETAVIGVAEQDKCRDDPGQNRGERVMAKLRTNHLNSEKKSLHELCFDYQDVLLAGGQIKLHKRGQAYYVAGAGGYPHEYTTLPITRKSKGRGRPSSEAAT